MSAVKQQQQAAGGGHCRQWGAGDYVSAALSAPCQSLLLIAYCYQYSKHVHMYAAMQGDHCCNWLDISSGALQARRTRNSEFGWASQASKSLHTVSGSTRGVF